MPAFLTRKELKEFFKTPLVDSPFIPRGEEGFLTWAPARFAPMAFAQADYNALVLLEPGAAEKALVKDVRLEAPRELKGRVVGPDGQPLPGVTVFGLSRSTRMDTLKGAEFTVRGFNPKTKRQLLFRHKDKHLGFFLKELTGQESGPLTIKLQSCGSVSGRIVRRDDQPVAGLRLRVTPVMGGLLGGGDEVVTDKEGRFRAEALVPGVRYGLMLVQASAVLKIPPQAIVAQVSVDEPGKSKDMGDIKLGR
jgi:hypothetical protein